MGKKTVNKTATEFSKFLTKKVKGILIFCDAFFRYDVLICSAVILILLVSQHFLRENINSSKVYILLEIFTAILISYFGGSAIQAFNKVMHRQDNPIYQKGLTSVRTLTEIRSKLLLIRTSLKENPLFNDRNVAEERLFLERSLDFLEMDITNAVLDWYEIFPKIKEDGIEVIDTLHSLEREFLEKVKDGENNTNEIRQKLKKIGERISNLEYPYQQIVASGTGPTGPQEFIVDGNLTAFGPSGPTRDLE